MYYLQFLFLLRHDVLADGGHGQHEADQQHHREVVVDEADVLVVAVRRVGEHLQTGRHRLVDLQPVPHYHVVVLRARIAQYVDDCRVDGVLQLDESLLVITCTTTTKIVSSRILRPIGHTMLRFGEESFQSIVTTENRITRAHRKINTENLP